MNMAIKIIVILALIGLLGIAVGSAMAKEKEEEAQLSFEIIFDQTAFKRGEPVNYLMRLTNIGEETLTVNKRFLVNWPSPSPHEVYFVIKNAEGHQLPFQLRVRAGDPKAHHFMELKPGEHADSYTYDLAHSYELTAKGQYTVFAVYENRTVPEGIKEAWTGRIVSKTHKIGME